MEFCGPVSRPLRRDAERNRQRILDAALPLIAEHGLGVSYDQLAEAADVAVGTVYRRFPDKESLIEALFTEQVHGITAIARAALEIEDPWQGLVTFLTQMLQSHADNRGLMELALGGAPGLELVCQAQEAITPMLGEMVDRARAAGQLRPGVGTEDIALIPLMVGGIIDGARDVDPNLWRRYLVLVLDGCRAQHSGDLPGATPTPDEYTRIKSNWQPAGAVRPALTRSSS